MGLTMSDESIIHSIEEALETIRPNIQMDGGNVKFVRFEEGVVYVQLLGACASCPASLYTIKYGVEELLRERVNQVREVVALEAEY